jgi:hypothetical protein
LERASWSILVDGKSQNPPKGDIYSFLSAVALLRPSVTLRLIGYSPAAIVAAAHLGQGRDTQAGTSFCCQCRQRARRSTWVQPGPGGKPAYRCRLGHGSHARPDRPPQERLGTGACPAAAASGRVWSGTSSVNSARPDTGNLLLVLADLDSVKFKAPVSAVDGGQLFRGCRRSHVEGLVCAIALLMAMQEPRTRLGPALTVATRVLPGGG